MQGEFDIKQVEERIRGTRFSGHLRHVFSVSSTNQLALDAAAAGARAGVWVADEQTAGRGRGGHSWHSVPGDGLYASALVTPRMPLAVAQSLPLATGLAVQAAVLEETGLTLDLRWPNDLMFGILKCGGILVESASESPSPDRSEAAPGLRYAVIGIGLNLNHASFPPDIASVATSLFLESGRRFEREFILAALLLHLDREVAALQVEGTARLYNRFVRASSWVSGKRVRVEEGHGYTGITRGLDDRGFLRVEDAQGQIRTVLSGGVRSA